MQKKLMLGAIVIVSIVLVGALINYMHVDSFSFAWALNFMLMMCTSIFTEVLNSELSSSYYDSKNWEQKGKVYEKFGVTIFRKILVLIGWEKVIRKSTPIEKNTSALKNLYLQTKKSEFNHLIILIIVSVATVCVAIQYGVIKSLWLVILNVLLNLYPILLQRYNRPRIARMLNLSKI